MMAKQNRGSKPRAVIGTHHGLMHGSQSHQQQFFRSSRGSNSTNISPKGSTRSSFSTLTNNRNILNILNSSPNSPKISTSSNISSLIGHETYKINLHSPLTSSASSSSEVLATAPKVNASRLKRHHSFAHSTTSGTSRTRNHNSDPDSMVRRLVAAVMSARLHVNKPLLRRSSLALHRINVHVGSRKGSGSSTNGNGMGGLGVNGETEGHSSEGNAFEELRLFIKQGGEFNKELVSTLHERAQLEATYARGLSKLSSKLFKATKESTEPPAGIPNTVSNAWHFVAEDMEATAETHRHVASVLDEELVKPLKVFAECQHKTRKSLEAAVDKRVKSLNEWRNSEGKTKMKCYSNAKSNERVQDALLDCKLGRGKVLSDRELVKLEGKRKKSGEQLRKSDLDYYSASLKAERSRLDWESSVLRGCSAMRRMEEDRLCQLRNLGEQYHQIMSDNRPKLVASSKRLTEPIQLCDISRDMEAVKRKIHIDEDSLGQQILPSFYAEDRTNSMNQERRRENLARCLRIIRSDIEREKKGKAGVENLAKALHETPKFGSEDSQQDVLEKLQHMKSMLTYLEATRFKVLNSLLEIEGRPSVSHPLGSHLSFAKDKHGMAKAILKMPYRRRQEDQPSVDYPSDIEEDRLTFGNTNPIVNGKLGYQNSVNLGSGLEMEDELREIDNDMFAIPHNKPPKPNKSSIGGGFTTDFTTSVLDGSALNHHHHHGNYNRGSTDAIATADDSDFDDFSDSGGGSNEEKDAVPPPHKSTGSISNHHHHHNNHSNVNHTKTYSQYQQNHVTNVIVETPPPTFNRDYNSEVGAGSGASTTSSSSGFNSGEGGVTSEHKNSQSSYSSSDTSPSALAQSSIAPQPSSLGQNGQTENEIEEICYQATTTTFSKVHTVPQFSDDDDVSTSPPPPPSQPPPLNDDFDLSEVGRSSSGYAPSPSIGQCRALYDYFANMYDELTIHVGDIINIHDKQADGWWLGELRGTVGIFPATYVEEMESNA